ncbi:MAG: YgaP family membrane protein [Rhodothermales bacterium]
MRIQKNMSRFDRKMRGLAGLVLTGLYLTGVWPNTIVLVFGLSLLGSTLIGVCWAYLPLGFKTNKPGEYD